MTPTIEQLLILVDRAERGRLSAAEARALRAGIEALVAAAEPPERSAAGCSDRSSPEKAPVRPPDGLTASVRPRVAARL